MVKGGAHALTLQDSIYMSGFVLEFRVSPCICRQWVPRGQRSAGGHSECVCSLLEKPFEVRSPVTWVI